MTRVAPPFRTARALVAIACALVVSFAGIGAACAHDAGVSHGRYALHDGRVAIRIVFANLELASSVAAIDLDRDGVLSAAEVAAARTSLQREIIDRLVVSLGGRACRTSLGDVTLTEHDGVELAATATCAEAASVGERVAIHAGFLDVFASQHRHFATLIDEDHHVDRDAVAVRGSMDFELGAHVPPSFAHSFAHSLGAFIVEGIEHILTGYDHLAFLVGLILLGSRPRALIMALTAFTVGHSASLGLAVLRVWSPSSRIVEPAIALSIAYVGLDDFLRLRGKPSLDDAARMRWLVTLPFGLVHGFGFAGALVAVELPRARVPVALLGFNLGVELGQVAVLGVVLPLVFIAHKRLASYGTIARVVSLALVAAGLVWFVARVRS